LPVDLPAAYRIADGERVDVHLSDLSPGGAFVDVERPPAFGAKVTLFVLLPNGKELAVESTVRWTKPGGMGLQFGLLDARDTYMLTEYLAKRKPAPIDEG
jgi:type IV pilus assembly protein PilZ